MPIDLIIAMLKHTRDGVHSKDFPCVPMNPWKRENGEINRDGRETELAMHQKQLHRPTLWYKRLSHFSTDLNVAREPLWPPRGSLTALPLSAVKIQRLSLPYLSLCAFSFMPAEPQACPKSCSVWH